MNPADTTKTDIDRFGLPNPWPETKSQPCSVGYREHQEAEIRRSPFWLELHAYFRSRSVRIGNRRRELLVPAMNALMSFNNNEPSDSFWIAGPREGLDVLGVTMPLQYPTGEILEDIVISFGVMANCVIMFRALEKHDGDDKRKRTSYHMAGRSALQASVQIIEIFAKHKKGNSRTERLIQLGTLAARTYKVLEMHPNFQALFSDRFSKYAKGLLLAKNIDQYRAIEMGFVDGVIEDNLSFFADIVQNLTGSDHQEDLALIKNG